MTPPARTSSAVVFVALLVLLAAPLPAQTTAAPSIEEVEATLAAIEADKGIEEAVKAPLRERYRKAIVALKEAADFQAGTQGLRAALSTAPGEISGLESRLAGLPPPTDAAKAAVERPPADLQGVVITQRAALNELSAALGDKTDELARVQERPFAIGRRLPENQRELSEIRRQLGSPTLAEDPTSPARSAERVLLLATESRLLAEAEMLEQEQLGQSLREDLLGTNVDLLQREVENAEAVLAALAELTEQQLAGEATRYARLIEDMLVGAPEDESLQGLAAELRELVREFEGVIEDQRAVVDANARIKSGLAAMKSRIDGLREELALSPGGQGMAQVMLDIERRHPARIDFVNQLSAGLPSLDATRLAELQVRTRLRDQPEVTAWLADHDSPTVSAMVDTRRKLLQELRQQYRQLLRELAGFEGNRQAYLDKNDELRGFAARQLFGLDMRSLPPIGLGTIAAIPASLGWLFNPAHWAELIEELWASAAAAPMRSTLVLLLVALLLAGRHRIGTALEATATPLRRIATDRFRYTLWALVLTVLLALPLPLLLGQVAGALGQVPDSSDWLTGMGLGLEVIAGVLLLVTFLVALARPGGLGEVHFRLQSTAMAGLRLWMTRFAWVFVPALLLALVGIYEQGSSFLESVGRLSFMLAQAWMTLILWQLLNFKDGVLAEAMRKEPAGLISRWRYLWFPLVLAYAAGLIPLAAVGYLITALILSIGLVGSAGYLVVGVTLFRLARRWFRIRQRRLALAEALESRRARREAAAEAGPEKSGDVVAVAPEAEEALDLVTVNQQTLQLLRLVFGLGTAIAILLAWSQAFPLGETLDDAVVPLTGGLTLLGLAKAILITVVTYIAAANLPGLMELAVLRTTALDAGTRHALSTLAQYAVIAIGLALLLTALQVDWSKASWIAAALSVGIGFGLQEVVANFVCGLILLFERPIRVGDVVTVGGVTGTVTKIQIRATTITTGDRQAYVVPNKSLITGPLLNWTRNEAGLNRITIRIGVATDTDADEARRLLLEIAGAHPRVLDAPAPAAIFEAFGASTLDLVLYAFLADVGSRATTTTELLTEIKRRFAAAGIEMPNPQYDITVQSLGSQTGSPGPTHLDAKTCA